MIITPDIIASIKEMAEQHMNPFQISNKLGIAHETAKKYMDKIYDSEIKIKHPKKFLKIKPFTEIIDAKLIEEPNISINRMFEYLVSQGYEGKKTILRIFLKKNTEKVLFQFPIANRKYKRRTTKGFIKVKAYKVLKDSMLFESEKGAINHIEELNMKEKIAQWIEANYHEGMSKEEITELLFKSALGVI